MPLWKRTHRTRPINSPVCPHIIFILDNSAAHDLRPMTFSDKAENICAAERKGALNAMVGRECVHHHRSAINADFLKNMTNDLPLNTIECSLDHCIFGISSLF